ncbi:type II restriction-modification system, methylation subunit [Sulfurovum sp. AR]|nr:type II restriction-modification system, methylation subunit [Sulfurovum sp. AR]
MTYNTLSYYDKNAMHLSDRYESANVDHLHSLLLDIFPNRSHLLEIGCGSGRDASFMVKNKFDILATDGSKEMIETAKQCHPEISNSLCLMQIPEDLSFEPSSFDGVYSIATLMHLQKNEIESTIYKISTIIKKGANFLFSVSIQRDDIDNQGKDKMGRHFTTMPESEWISYCEKYGMRFKYSKITGDGLNRDGIVWLTCVVKKEE